MNWQIVYPTTPAQFFHVLRRQVIRKWRKPLVVMTPKSMLRHPMRFGPIDDLTHGTYQPRDSRQQPQGRDPGSKACCCAAARFTGNCSKNAKI